MLFSFLLVNSYKILVGQSKIFKRRNKQLMQISLQNIANSCLFHCLNTFALTNKTFLAEYVQKWKSMQGTMNNLNISYFTSQTVAKKEKDWSGEKC